MRQRPARHTGMKFIRGMAEFYGVLIAELIHTYRTRNK